MTDTSQEITGAGAILRSLKCHGVDWLFANPGSDFAPIIEAYSAGNLEGEFPEFVLGLHEHICVSMAHGYWLATGRMQAVAVHVNVGLANTLLGLINAQSDDVPIFLLSGRTPLTEHGRLGSRGTPIQYGQEMFDQSALVREVVKWDYELRYAENAANLVSRAASIAKAEPTGSVYLSLPREPLCESAPWRDPIVQNPPAAGVPNSGEIAAAAQALAAARNPLIVCSRGDPGGGVGRELAALATENDIAVSEVFVTRNVMPSRHPCMIGPDLPELLPEADVVLVVDSPVAWIESKVQPAGQAQVIHLGPDPQFARLPVRSYRCDLAISCNAAAGLEALRAALPGTADGLRSAEIAVRHKAYCRQLDKLARTGSTGLASKAWVAQCLSETLGEDAVIYSERGGRAPTFNLTRPNQWFGNTQAGGLGWALPASMGHKLADRGRQVACVIGDGGYVLANPVACHQVAGAQELPVLTVILNNGGWEAVRLSTLEVYPHGAAASANEVPMVPFDPVPDYGAIAAAAGAWSRTVERAEELPKALAAAVAVIQEEKRQAVLDVKVGADTGPRL